MTYYHGDQVSELLGSFGDNELSPECLDGAQRFLAEDGISIPANYISYLAPMTCSKLHNDCKAYKDLEHLETAYVVKVRKGTRPLPDGKQTNKQTNKQIHKRP
eukprot:461064-Pyramimonas_sp.AAC.1